MKGSEGKELDADLLVERMRRVRSAGHIHASELQGEVKRLVDWKEYVFSRPIASVAAATVLGFAIVRSTVRVVSKPTPGRLAEISKTPENGSLSSTFTGGMINLGTSIASSAIKSYFANLVQRSILERSSSVRLQKFSPGSNDVD